MYINTLGLLSHPHKLNSFPCYAITIFLVSSFHTFRSLFPFISYTYKLFYVLLQIPCLVLVPTWPPKNSVVKPTNAVSTHNTSNTLIVSSNTASNSKSSVINKIIDSATNQSDHPAINATKEIQNANNKSANVPAILASVFGSLLVLCFIVCTVGLILRKKSKKDQVRGDGFKLAISSTFQR